VATGVDEDVFVDELEVLVFTDDVEEVVLVFTDDVELVLEVEVVVTAVDVFDVVVVAAGVEVPGTHW
jgi:hypothetical protein